MESEIELSIIRKMVARRVIGSRAVSEGNLIHWCWKPKEKSFVRKALKSLIKKGTVKVVDKSKKLVSLDKEHVAKYLT